MSTDVENAGFLNVLSAPARRALENERIISLKILSRYTKQEIAKLHGIGKTSIPKLEEALKAEGLSFKITEA
jgi:DNA-directed RNA polymerase alpha subunit